MSVSYKEATDLLSALQEIEISETSNSYSLAATQQENASLAQTPPFFTENGLNISALSLESCDAQELMHCYQLALDFGVPTARRALALYQSRSSIRSTIHKES